ncbi:MAG TPA: PAS domain-containing sensor histidine kinase, partial [Sphingobacteriaceae bacterium]
MRSRLEKVLFALYVALVAIIILPVLVFYHYELVFDQSSYWIRNNQNVLRQAEEVGMLSRMVVLESNTYLVTGGGQYHRRYTESKDRLLETLPVFRSLMKTNAAAAPRCDTIIRNVDSLLVITDRDVALSPGSAFDPGHLRSSVENKLLYLTRITRQIDRIEADERELLYERNRSYMRTISAYNKLFVVYVVVVILLLVTSFLFIRFNLRKRRAAEEQQRISEDDLRSLINSVKDYAIFRLDRDGMILNWNHGAENLTGYTQDEIIGRSFRIFYAPGDLAMGTAEKDLAMAARKGHLEKENWLARKDGSSFWANLYMIATHDQHGHITGFTQVLQDFTERKQLDEARNRALQQERDLNKLKSNFVAMASHEFRTPLTAIHLAATAIRDYKGRVNQDKYLDMIMTNIQTLMTILEEFLNLEKMEAGKVATNSDIFDVRENTEKVCSEFRVNGTHTVIYEHKGDSMFFLDPLIYKQILTNLVSNAI